MFKDQFPIFSVSELKEWSYLDNTATTQKPKRVIDRLTRFYSQEYATIHRGVYRLSQEATEYCDTTRRLAKGFLNAKREEEIVFVKGTTEAINLVAKTYVKAFIKPGQSILITEMEHHANIVPWQQVCEMTGAVLKVASITESGELDLDSFRSHLDSSTFFVSLAHISNALGTVNPIKTCIDLAHSVGAKVLIDAAQSVAHTVLDVQVLDCDFLCFSSHKMYGPTGIGILYGKYDLLDQMPVYETGGDMVETVLFEKTTFQKAPAKFEPGTPAIAEIIGLGEAFQFLTDVGLERISDYEHALLVSATEKLSGIPGIRLIGTAKEKASLISFVLDGVHPHDAGTILDEAGVAVRVGHHCAQPVMRRFGVPATIRASFSLYNTDQDIDRLVKGIYRVLEIMK